MHAYRASSYNTFRSRTDLECTGTVLMRVFYSDHRLPVAYSPALSGQFYPGYVASLPQLPAARGILRVSGRAEWLSPRRVVGRSYWFHHFARFDGLIVAHVNFCQLRNGFGVRLDSIIIQSQMMGNVPVLLIPLFTWPSAAAARCGSRGGRRA